MLVEEDLPGFAAPPPPPPSPSSPPADDPTLARAIPPDDVDRGDAAAADTTTGGRSSRASTDDRGPLVVDGEAVATVLGLLLKFLSTLAHWALAPRRPRNDVWLADEDDLATIAPPLARIAARHLPVARFITSDLADGLMAGVGVSAYVEKNLDRRAQLHPDNAPPVDLTDVDHDGELFLDGDVYDAT